MRRFTLALAFVLLASPSAAQTELNPVEFSAPGAILVDPFKLDITHDRVFDDPRSFVYYTLDHSDPTPENGTLFVWPITIDSTTVVRAAAFMEGATPSPITTHTYIFPADVIRQSRENMIAKGWPSYWGESTVDMGLDSNIVAVQEAQLIRTLSSAPSLSLVLPFTSLFDEESGIFANPQKKGRDWERPVSIELIYPPEFSDEIGQNSRHGNRDGFAVNAGVRVRGAWNGRTPANPKRSLRLYFRGSYGPKNLKYDLFGDEGVNEFDKIDLRAEVNHSWSFDGSSHHTLVRDVFSRDTQGDMGLPYTRSRYYHLYLNGQYWGVFQTQERADQWHGEFYIRGDKDDYDVVKHDGGSIEFSEGTDDAWRLLYYEANRLARLDDENERDSLYMKLQGMNPDGTPNSDFPVLLDADNLIQYMLIIFWTANRDGPILGEEPLTNNWIGLRDREGDQGFAFFVHDAEFTLFPGHDRTGPFAAGADVRHSNPQWIHQQLMGSRKYRLRFSDLAHQHFFGEGALSDSSVLARWDARVNEVRPMIIAESARWGDFKSDPAKTPHDWLRAIDFVREQFFTSRTPIVIEQLRQAKRWEFGQPGDPLVPVPLYGDISTSTAMDVKVPETILEQNYPNPFAGETTLQFTTEKPGHVRLDVFDVLGRRIATVTDQPYRAGAHRVRWNSETMPSGVYFVRMEVVGQQVGVQKVVRR